jgi:hypothetical protein
MSKARKAKGEAGETGGDVVPVAEVIEKVVAAREYQFTKENAAEAQAASRVSLVKNNLEKKIVKLEATEEIRRRQDQIAKLGLTKMSTEVTREQLPEIGLAIIADHGLRVLGGEWEMKTAEEATKVAKVWHDILRLEMGEPTTISSSQDSESPDQRKNRFEELKIEAKRRVEGGLRAIAGDAG